MTAAKARWRMAFAVERADDVMMDASEAQMLIREVQALYEGMGYDMRVVAAYPDQPHEANTAQAHAIPTEGA